MFDRRIRFEATRLLVNRLMMVQKELRLAGYRRIENLNSLLNEEATLRYNLDRIQGRL